MIVLDTTIVNVALPAIQQDLHFSQANLTWVVNAFLVTFGSFLLLAGRLGDLFGRKRVFLAGVVDLHRRLAAVRPGARPGRADRRARFLQGIGAAVQASVILAIIVTEFPRGRRPRPRDERVRVRRRRRRLARPARRRRCSRRRSAGTGSSSSTCRSAPLTFVLGRALIPADRAAGRGFGVDWLGSLLVTASLMTAIYAIVAGHEPRLGLDPRARLRRRSRPC